MKVGVNIKETILSAGIDIGTSTTQMIFCRLTIENLASSYTVPRISIVKKEVIHRSDIYFTPLLSQTEIDAESIKKIVLLEYEKANIKIEDIKTGAVIITGDTARKKNANAVIQSLSKMAGDFVVATAGPDLESVLSAKGAGTDILSKEKRLTIANLDIGGGTTNIGVYQNGNLKSVACMDIGGRLIKVENGKITYIYEKIKELAILNNIDINVNDIADILKIKRICKLMTDLICETLNIKEKSSYNSKIYTNNGKGIDDNIEAITFSGGVADCIYKNTNNLDVFKYGDIGILLGRAIKESIIYTKLKVFDSVETIRATVVGAGTHTTEISGSTILYEESRLPLKNIPILRVDDENNLDNFVKSIKTQIPLYREDGVLDQIAIAFSGDGISSFSDIQNLAKAIATSTDEIVKSGHALILIIENDIAKALGHALKVILKVDIISIDTIKTLSGDYVDIGKPIADGRVVPVIIKTLIFNS